MESGSAALSGVVPSAASSPGQPSQSRVKKGESERRMWVGCLPEPNTYEGTCTVGLFDGSGVEFVLCEEVQKGPSAEPAEKQIQLRGFMQRAHLLVLMSLRLAINQRNPALRLMFRLVSATPYLYTKPSLQFTLYTSQLIHFPRSEDFSLRRATSDLVIQSDVIP